MSSLKALVVLVVACLVRIEAYDATLSPYERSYTDGEKDQQRAAGRKLLEDIERALSAKEDRQAILASYPGTVSGSVSKKVLTFGRGFKFKFLKSGSEIARGLLDPSSRK